MAKYGSQRLGCLPKLFIFIVVVVLMFLGLVVGLVWWGVTKAEPWLSEEAMKIPSRPLPAEQYAEVEQRVARLSAAKQQGVPYQLVLTTEEINGLIAQHPSFEAARDQVFVRIKDSRGFVYFTLPMDLIPIVNWFAGGKHLNVVVDASPVLKDDRLVLDLQQCWINDKKLPEEDVRTTSKSFDARMNDPSQSAGRDMENALRNLSGFGLRDGAVVIETGGYGRMTGEPLPTPQAAPPPPGQ